MQAAARSYRLNQTHTHCKVIYLYAEGTMEQTAVQLMSRKQRAAKLLTGDIGLTGLDALTEGEGGFEQALLDAIGRDDTLLDPSQLFKASGEVSDIDAEDAGYWNIEGTAVTDDAPICIEPQSEVVPLADPLIALAVEMGATVTPMGEPTTETVIAAADQPEPRPVDAVIAYLETVHLVADERIWTTRRAELLAMLDGGTADVIAAWLTEQHVVFPGFEREVAERVVSLIGAHTEPLTVRPPAPTVPAKQRREVERPARTFPRHTDAEPLTQQMALF